MKNTTAIIAGVITVSFLGIMSLKLMAPMEKVIDYGLDKFRNDIIDHIQSTSSLFNGILGIILGYYFGAGEDPTPPAHVAK